MSNSPTTDQESENEVTSPSNTVTTPQVVNTVTPQNNILTFGEKAVGISFNPSGDEEVNRVKNLMAQVIDILEKKHAEKTDNGNAMSSWVRNVFRTQAFNAIVTAQMAVVKYLTWTD